MPTPVNELVDLSLWTVSNDRPDAKVADLTTMETITAGNGNITYTAPSNTYLLPETTYAVVTSAVASRKVLEFVGDNGEDCRPSAIMGQIEG